MSFMSNTKCSSSVDLGSNSDTGLPSLGRETVVVADGTDGGGMTPGLDTGQAV